MYETFLPFPVPAPPLSFCPELVGTPGPLSSPLMGFLDEISNDWEAWQQLPSPVMAADSLFPFYTDAFFTNLDTGWVIGWNQQILYTHSAGQSWTQLPSPDSSVNELNGIVITPDSQKIWIVGNEGLLITTQVLSVIIGGIREEPGRDCAIFPNPNNGSFHIQNPFPQQRKEALIMLYDMQGRLLVEQSLSFTSGEKQKVDFEGLDPGLYLLQLMAEGEVFRIKKVWIAK